MIVSTFSVWAYTKICQNGHFGQNYFRPLLLFCPTITVLLVVCQHYQIICLPSDRLQHNNMCCLCGGVKCVNTKTLFKQQLTYPCSQMVPCVPTRKANGNGRHGQKSQSRINNASRSDLRLREVSALPHGVQGQASEPQVPRQGRGREAAEPMRYAQYIL